jgi:predicted AAA+ superfamily ATPase
MSRSWSQADLFIDREELSILVQWLASPTRKPLVLRGARQVGKSALVRRLAHMQGLKLAEVNFEFQPSLSNIFSSGEPDKMVTRLQQALGVRLDAGTLLFLDEVQASESAFASLRYFYEKHPEVPVVAAGSLLEFSLSQFQQSMPVGRVTFRWIPPISFRDYLKARHAEVLLSAIQDFVEEKDSKIHPEAHDNLLSELARYVYIGGMPEAMRQAVANESWDSMAASVAEAHSDILLSYRNDFYKYRGRIPVESLHAVLDAIPILAATSKVKYSNISREIRSDSLKNALRALEKAGVLRMVFATNANGIPLSASKDTNCFKVLPIDVGLFVSQSFGSQRAERPYTDLFNKWTQGNVFEQRWLGQIAEILVGQSLQHSLQSNDHLHFWLRESKGAEAELDYVLQYGTRIIPVEVKAGASGTLRSLHSFMAEKGLPMGVRFDLNAPSVQDIDINVPIAGGKLRNAKYRLRNFPLYLADWLPELLKRY